MRENIKIYTLCTLISLCILSLGSSFSEPFSLSIRIISFVIPSVLCLKLCKTENYKKNYFKLDKDSLIVIPAALPSLLFIFFISYIVSLVIFNITGHNASVPASGNLFYDVLNLALIPALLEEMLFRFVPLKIIAPYSKKTALIISSVFFAMVHTSFFSIPYALTAGILFMLFDLISNSIWPSVILHLLNNLISIAWIYGSANATFKLIFISGFVISASLSLISLLFVIKKLKQALNEVFKKEDIPEFPFVTLSLIIPTLIIALFEFI